MKVNKTKYKKNSFFCRRSGIIIIINAVAVRVYIFSFFFFSGHSIHHDSLVQEKNDDDHHHHSVLSSSQVSNDCCRSSCCCCRRHRHFKLLMIIIIIPVQIDKQVFSLISIQIQYYLYDEEKNKINTTSNKMNDAWGYIYEKKKSKTKNIYLPTLIILGPIIIIITVIISILHHKMIRNGRIKKI